MPVRGGLHGLKDQSLVTRPGSQQGRGRRARLTLAPARGQCRLGSRRTRRPPHALSRDVAKAKVCFQNTWMGTRVRPESRGDRGWGGLAQVSQKRGRGRIRRPWGVTRTKGHTQGVRRRGDRVGFWPVQPGVWWCEGAGGWGWVPISGRRGAGQSGLEAADGSNHQGHMTGRKERWDSGTEPGRPRLETQQKRAGDKGAGSGRAGRRGWEAAPHSALTGSPSVCGLGACTAEHQGLCLPDE